MKHYPPHLPPPSCSIPLRRRFLSLAWLLFFVLIAVLSGIAAAVLTVTTLLPQTQASTVLGGVEIRYPNQERVTIDEWTFAQVSQRMVKLFDSRAEQPGGFYSDDAAIGDGILLSSDGWVLVGGDVEGGTLSRAVAMDTQGITYEVEEYIVDPLLDVTYVKISGEGFRITPFADAGQLQANQTLIAQQDASVWSLAHVGDWEMTGARNAAMWSPRFSLRITESLFGAPFVFLPDGSLAGIVDSEGEMTPAWFVESQLPHILEGDIPQYTGLPVRGEIVRRYAQGGDEVGFRVTGLTVPARETELALGDVILAVENRAISAFRLPEIALFDESATVTVFRDGQSRDILVQAHPLRP